MKRLFLIDGTALAYRSHFALSTGTRGGLSTRDGRPTSAVYGFTMALRAMLDQEKPDAVVIAFDGPRADLVRTRLYADYKSTRNKMPDELTPQLPIIEEVARGHGCTMVALPGHEADDVIATLALRARERDYDVYIATGDKDFMQIVQPHVRLWNLRSSARAPEVIGPAEVEARYGVRPEQMVDLLALMGDSSDNIPGVPRIGEKTGASLLQQFGSLDELLRRIDEVKPPGCRAALEQHREQALLSRQLVTLYTDLPVELPFDDLRPCQPDRAVLEPIFRDLEFDRLVASLPAAERLDEAREYRVVRTEAELRELIADLRASGGFAFATEATTLDAMQARLVGVAFSHAEGQAIYVPFNLRPPILPGGADAVIAALRPLLEDSNLQKTGANLKHDLTIWRRAGIDVRGAAFDTSLASYCLSPGQGGHDLAALARRFYGYEKTAVKALVGTGKKQKTFDEVDVELAGRYAAEDADLAWRVRRKLEPELERRQLLPLFRDLEMPLLAVLLDMELEGIAIDVGHLERLSQQLAARIAQLEARIYERAGEPFNLNSGPQIGEILFERLEVHRAAGMSRPRKTPSGQYKTDAAVLELLAAHHEVPQLLLEYRQLAKLKSTYVDSLPTMVNPQTGRVHTTFQQAVAATGRLSSDNPNLQNIPIRTAEGREVRRAFVARAKHWRLMSADYSQIELRILAHVSGDPALVESFQRGEDIHTRTAALVHGLLPGMVGPELRNQAKVVNYGLMYGMGPARLASETGMTPPEAKRFIDAYFKALPKVKQYLDETLRHAREHREVRTMFGRVRPLPEIDSTSTMQRVAAENMAVNSPIQGAAADIIKRAMLAVHDDLARGGFAAKLLLQVHDELVLDVPEAELDAVTELVRRCMCGAAELTVPLEVSVGHGANWLEAH